MDWAQNSSLCGITSINLSLLKEIITQLMFFQRIDLIFELSNINPINLKMTVLKITPPRPPSLSKFQSYLRSSELWKLLNTSRINSFVASGVWLEMKYRLSKKIVLVYSPISPEPEVVRTTKFYHFGKRRTRPFHLKIMYKEAIAF